MKSLFKQEITPSILNVKPEERIKVITELLKLGIKWIHYDIMDGVFVPNQAISIAEIKSFYEQLPKHLSDVHLMVSNPWEYAEALKDYTNCLTVHYEAFANDQDLINFVEHFTNGNWIGLAIKPQTSFAEVSHLLYLFDLLLIMAVEPGQGGQAFLEQTYIKIADAAQFIDNEKLPTIIQVDGGIKDHNSAKVFAAGSQFNVVGTYLVENLNKASLEKLKP